MPFNIKSSLNLSRPCQVSCSLDLELTSWNSLMFSKFKCILRLIYSFHCTGYQILLSIKCYLTVKTHTNLLISSTETVNTVKYHKTWEFWQVPCKPEVRSPYFRICAVTFENWKQGGNFSRFISVFLGLLLFFNCNLSFIRNIENYSINRPSICSIIFPNW